MIRLGLTGSIGMGKSTIARMFKDENIPVWDADEAVHRLYASSALAKERLTQAFGDVVTNGQVDRAKLSEMLKAAPHGFERLNAIVHPMLSDDRLAFIAAHHDAPLVVLDIPLLYEGNSLSQLDKVVVVSAPADIQRQRVLSRPGMTADKLAVLLSRQMPDSEKRARADFIIDTSQSLEACRGEVVKLIAELSAPAIKP